MIPFIIDTTNPTQSGLLSSFNSPGGGINPDFVFRDVQLAFYHRPVVPAANPSGSTFWQDDWIDTDTFQIAVGNRDTPPVSGTFPIGVFAGTITGNTVAASTVVTPGTHNLTTGDEVLIFGSNSTPSIDGLYTATVLSATTFSIPVTVTVAGTAGSVYDANTLDALAYNISAGSFTTALSAITVKHGYPAVTVSLLSTGQYLVQGNANGALPSLYSPTINALVPQSGVGITVATSGDASNAPQQIVTLYQVPVAYSEPSTPLPVADINESITQMGDSTHNKIYAITLTAGTYGGTFSVSLTCIDPSAGTFGIIANGGVSATDFQTQLVNATGLQNTDFNVTRVNDVLNVEFAGTQGNSNVPVLSVANIDLLAPLGVSGFINFNTFALLDQFSLTTGNELTFTMSIRRTRATGEQAEYFIQDVILKRNLIQGVGLIPVPLPSFLTTAQSDARYLRKNANSVLAAGFTLSINSTASIEFLSGSSLTVDSGATLSIASGGTLSLFGTSVTSKTGTGAIVLSPGTLAVASGKTLTSSNTITLTATDGSTLAIGTGGTLGTGAYAAAFNPAIPGPIGGTTPAAITGTIVTATSQVIAPSSLNYAYSFAGNLTTGIGYTPNTITIAIAALSHVEITYGTQMVVNVNLSTTGNLICSMAGKTLQIASGTNAKAGTFTLVAGAATVSNTSVTANSVILVTLKTLGGTRAGIPDIVPTATTGFVATAVGTDTSIYNYVIMEVA